MVQEITPVNTTKVIKRTVSYYSFVIFVIVVAAGLIVAVIILTNIFINPPIKQTDSTGAASFDEATINRVNRLENSRSNTSYRSIQSGRINPFSE